MSCPLPGESLFNTADNHINLLAYKKICNEFGVHANADFRFRGGNNGGLGTMYNYATRIGYRPLTGVSYDPSRFQFIPQTTSTVIKIDYISQSEAADGWVQFILEKSLGFTRAGVIRIDDSIRAYAYSILGSQAQTRSNITKSLECQQNFVDLLESNVKKLFSIPESIRKYQDAISNTNVRINYAVGIGLYMIPSNLVLHVGVIQKYNNNRVIADDSREMGENEDINSLDSVATVNPRDSAEAVNPVDSAATVDSAAEQHATRIFPTEIGAGIAFVVFILFLTLSS